VPKINWVAHLNERLTNYPNPADLQIGTSIFWSMEDQKMITSSSNMSSNKCDNGVNVFSLREAHLMDESGRSEFGRYKKGLRF
jgi:hypothetical protein